MNLYTIYFENDYDKPNQWENFSADSEILAVNQFLTSKNQNNSKLIYVVRSSFFFGYKKTRKSIIR